MMQKPRLDVRCAMLSSLIWWLGERSKSSSFLTLMNLFFSSLEHRELQASFLMFLLPSSNILKH